MSAGRLFARGTLKFGNGQVIREASRTRLYATLTLAAGTVAGIAAATAIGAPIASAHVRPDPAIPASALFTPVPPIQKTVDVFDPAPPAPRVAPAAVPAPQQSQAPEPRETPEHESEQEGSDR